MNELISKIPTNLPTWSYVLIFLGIIAGIVLITRLTGNRSKKIAKFSNISQSGSNNNQKIGENIDNKDR